MEVWGKSRVASPVEGATMRAIYSNRLVTAFILLHRERSHTCCHVISEPKHRARWGQSPPAGVWVWIADEMVS